MQVLAKHFPEVVIKLQAEKNAAELILEQATQHIE